MKRITIYTLSAVFFAVGMVSCAKSTKGKVSNEWKVTSLEDVQSSVNSNNDHSTSTLSMTETTVTNTDVNTPATGPSSTDSETGTINKNEFVIKKDGTWSWLMDVTYVNGSSTTNQLIEQIGTWSFVGKTKGDDFKKNERVLFNTLISNGTETTMVNQVIVDTYSDHVTYATGNNTMIYTITESKKNKLELEMESKYVSTQDASTYSSSNSRKITLEEK
jgi:hypothetical protein